MKILSKTGFLLSFVFIIIVVYLERNLLNCPYELYRCTNVIPAMPWYLFLESLLDSILINTMLLYLVGLYIDRDRGEISLNKKLRFVTVFTSILNFAFGVIFIALGWFGSTYAPVPDSSELLLSQLMIPVGFVISVMSIWIFFTTKIKVYIGLAAITLSSIILWMIVISSYDMFWGFLAYVLLMTPLFVMRLKFKSARDPIELI